MFDVRQSVARLKAMDGDVMGLGHVAALLEWDQETYIPSQGIADRASQTALIRGLQHEKIIKNEWGEIFDRLDCNSEGFSPLVDAEDTAFVREAWKRWTKKTRVEKSLVEELARAGSTSQAAWVYVRKDKDFSAFQPHLKKMISLQKEYAQSLSDGEDEYDTLLDEYEPGVDGKVIAEIFDGLASGLTKILDSIQGGQAPNTKFLKRPYPIKPQDVFGRRIHNYMGYDYQRGRLDLSAHPFTSTLGFNDIRITTRYDENQVLSGLFSNIHEAGHGLYEQGVGKKLKNTLLADGASLGIHESQSRFWENTVGRSKMFWHRWYGDFRDLFPQNLKDIREDDFYRAVNSVSPSLVRVEADEVTYSFHVIIRFRLERALVKGELDVADLPEAWETSYREFLGIAPRNDSEGCMQDIHWAVGLFGYFPTYALGNLYSAQFTHAMEGEIGCLDDLIKKDAIDQISNWLHRNIYQHGRTFLPSELCSRICGKPLDPHYFLDYLKNKYSDIYGF